MKLGRARHRQMRPAQAFTYRQHPYRGSSDFWAYESAPFPAATALRLANELPSAGTHTWGVKTWSIFRRAHRGPVGARRKEHETTGLRSSAPAQSARSRAAI